MNNIENLDKLLTSVSLSDRSAFQQLYQCSNKKLYGIAIRITRDSRLAEDALQEGFMSIWHNASLFDPQKAQAITWMGTIVRNKAIDTIRKQQNNTDTLNEEIISDMGNSTEEYALKTSDHELLNKCLRKLDKKYYDTILLAYLEGYTHKEIAAKQLLSISNVKNRIHRGVIMVKKCVQKNTGIIEK